MPVSKPALWTGRILSALFGLFLLFDAVMKLAKPSVVVKGTVEMGYPESAIVPLGITLLVCTLLWGTTFIVVQTAQRSSSPEILVFGRFTVAHHGAVDVMGGRPGGREHHT